MGAVLAFLFACSAHADLIDYFATPDQQGRWYFERGDYKIAAARFTDPAWKGLSFYRAGDFGNALAEFSRLDTADGYFLQGNAQAHLRKYEAAVKSYDNALHARADFPQAKANRALVAALIPKPEDESDEEPPDLPPDEVKFDDKGKHGKEKAMSPEMVRKLTADLWMKNLRHSRAGGNPGGTAISAMSWIPACAGMTAAMAVFFNSIAVFAADSPGILVRTRLEPTSVSISQAATLHVEVYTDAFFTSGISLPPLTIPGAIVKLSDERPLHLNTTVKETNWTGIEHKYTVTPIVAVDLDIPAFEVSAHAGPASTPVTAKTRAVKLQVSAPAEAGDAFITHDLKLTQKTDADLAALKVGDSFTRSIELQATGTPAMFIPDVDFGDVPGLKAYPQPPLLTDSAPDAPLRGTRTFAVSYVVQEAGDFDLPAIAVRWWDLDTKQLRTAQVPALNVHAVAKPSSPPAFSIPVEAPAAAPHPAIDWRTWLLSAAVVVATSLALYLLAPHAARSLASLRRRYQQQHAAYLQSERFAYRRLETAIRSDRRKAIPAALYRWLDTLPVSRGRQRPGTTRDLDCDTGFADACDELLQECYGRSRDTRKIRWHLRRARRGALSQKRPQGEAVRLPALNP